MKRRGTKLYSGKPSSDLFKTTRVKSRRKQAKKTVGITISPQLLAEARKHNLNISLITEQALQSILEYITKQNETKIPKNQHLSSEFLTRGSFQKETLMCRGPGLNRRQLGLQPSALPG